MRTFIHSSIDNHAALNKLPPSPSAPSAGHDGKHEGRKMRTEQAKVEAFTIFDAPKLDPIFVVMQDLSGGKGRVLVECYGLAWSVYWGAMGAQTLREFFTAVGADYIANRMWPSKQRRVKSDYDYLVRIIEAVQSALNSQALCAISA